MLLETVFQRLGLPKHSHTIYAAIEKHGPLLASHAAELTSLHRPATYRALKELLKHRFIFVSPDGKRRVYRAADRNIIAQEFSETSAKITAKMSRAAITKEAYLQKEIIFLEGKAGIRAAFDDVVRHTPRGETFYRYTSEKNLEEVNKMLSPDYRKNRDAKKLERLVISNPVSGKQKRSRLERFIRFIPPQSDIFQQNIIQLIYGDRMSLIDLNTKRIIIIENKSLAEFQKTIFQQLYKSLHD